MLGQRSTLGPYLILGLSWAIGHFGVVEFWVHARRLQKNTVNKIQRKTSFFRCVADVFDAMFNYVCEVFFWCFWWCMGGLLLVGVLVVVAWHVVSSHNMGRYFNGVLHLHAQTQYTSIHSNQTILHTCGPWHLQRFSCPDRRSRDKEKAACVACDKVNKCKSHPKKWKTAKTILHFPGKARFFLRVFYLTEWLKILCEFFRIFWQLASQVQVTSI